LVYNLSGTALVVPSFEEVALALLLPVKHQGVQVVWAWADSDMLVIAAPAAMIVISEFFFIVGNLVVREFGFQGEL